MYSTAVWVGHPTSREYTGFGGPTAGPVWRAYMESAQGGNCPEFETPSSLPELEGLNGGHTSSSGYQGYEGEEEFESEEPEEGEEEAEGKEKGGKEGGDEPAPAPEPAPEPAPAPAPAPSPPPGGGLSPG